MKILHRAARRLLIGMSKIEREQNICDLEYIVIDQNFDLPLVYTTLYTESIL